MRKARVPIRNLPRPAFEDGFQDQLSTILPWLQYFQAQFYRVFFFVIDLLILAARFR